MEKKNNANPLPPILLTLLAWIVMAADFIVLIPSVNQIMAAILSLLLWLAGAVGILLLIKKQNPRFSYYQHHAFEKADYMTLFFVVMGGITIAAGNYLYGGLKPLFVREYLNGHVLYTIRNLLYYPLEVLLMLELLMCSQKSGELLTKRPDIPFGAFALFAMWGLPHLLGHNLADGIVSALHAFLYCIPFYSSSRNIKTSCIGMLVLWLL